MNGFFSEEETKATIKRNNCLICKLGKYEHKEEIDQSDCIFVMSSNEAKSDLSDFLKEVNISDSHIMQSVLCKLPLNREASQKEIECCREYVIEEIKRRQPKVVVALGIKALEMLIGDIFPEALDGINRWRGYVIPDRRLNTFLVPTYSAKFTFMDNHKRPVIKKLFSDDIRKARSVMRKAFPKFEDEKKQIIFINNERELEILLLRIIKDKPLLAFDYECTGLKPHNEGHAIVSASLCFEENQAYAFMVPSIDSRSFKLWKRILQDENIKKTGHNIKYETAWSKEILGVDIKGWVYCSMIGSHVIDNRQGVTGLKFQTYVNFGVPDYSSHMKQWLESGSDNANAFNKIREAPKDKLLLYGGLDALFQFRLAKIQMKRIEME